MNNQFKEKEHSLGLAAFILGIIGLITSCIFIGIIFDIIAIVFGIIVIAKKNSKKVFAITGVVLGSLGVLVMIGMIIMIMLLPPSKKNYTKQIITEQNTSTITENNTEKQTDSEKQASEKTKKNMDKNQMKKYIENAIPKEFKDKIYYSCDILTPTQGDGFIVSIQITSSSFSDKENCLEAVKKIIAQLKNSENYSNIKSFEFGMISEDPNIKNNGKLSYRIDIEDAQSINLDDLNSYIQTP